VLTLDTTITPELAREGAVRDMIRAVQDLRKQTGLVPDDVIVLTVFAEGEMKETVQEYMGDVQKQVNAESVVFGGVLGGTEVVTGLGTVVIALSKQ